MLWWGAVIILIIVHVDQGIDGGHNVRNGPVLLVNIMGSQEPLLNIFISNRYNDIVGDGV